MGHQGYGIDPERLSDYARQIKEVSEMGVQIGIVIGGGNIFRGLSGSQKGFDRGKGDQMGMCASSRQEPDRPISRQTQVLHCVVSRSRPT